MWPKVRDSSGMTEGRGKSTVTTTAVNEDEIRTGYLPDRSVYRCCFADEV